MGSLSAPDSSVPRSLEPSRATWSALGALALWSSLAAFSIRLRHVPPFFLVGATLLIGGLAGVRRIELRKTRPIVLLLGLYGLFAYHLCLFLALRLAPPVEANLLNYLWPLLIVLLSPLFVAGARLRPRHLAGALLGFGGAALLVTGGKAQFLSSGTAGYAFAVAAAFIWSTYSLWTKRLGNFPTSTVATFCLASGALSLACHALFEARYVPSLGDFGYLVAIGLGPMGTAFYLWDHALKTGDPRVIGTLAYLTPLFSTLLIVAFGEGRLGALTILAMAMIVSGAVLGAMASDAVQRS
jgi:drug/metabolite transporter (DMT)-like permease